MSGSGSQAPTEPGAADLVVFGFVDDLMDRSKISAAIPSVQFVRTAAALRTTALGTVALGTVALGTVALGTVALGTGGAGAGAKVVVVVDLARHAGVVEAVRQLLPNARLIGFAPHVEEISRASEQTGVDLSMPRSRFFHDVVAAVSYS